MFLFLFFSNAILNIFKLYLKLVHQFLNKYQETISNSKCDHLKHAYLILYFLQVVFRILIYLLTPRFNDFRYQKIKYQEINLVQKTLHFFHQLINIFEKFFYKVVLIQNDQNFQVKAFKKHLMYYSKKEMVHLMDQTQLHIGFMKVFNLHFPKMKQIYLEYLKHYCILI